MKIKFSHLTLLLVFLLCSNANATLKKANDHNEFRTSFELINNFIVIKVKLNDKVEDFVLDSGSPVILLNNVYYKDTSQNTMKILGINGSQQAGKYKIEKFEWNNKVITDKDLMTTNLENLSQATGKAIKGLIGYTQLKDCEVLIDYKKKELLISRGRKLNLHVSGKPIDSVSFIYSGHMPVISTQIGSTTYNLGIDSGAGNNLLSLPVFDQLPKATYELMGAVKLGGGGENLRDVNMFSLIEFSVWNTRYEKLEFVSSDISHLNKDLVVKIDGLLGYPYLSRYKTSIDFAGKKIYIWP